MNLNERLNQVVSELTTSERTDALLYHHTDGHPLPSLSNLTEIIDLCRAILFPVILVILELATTP